MNILSAIKQKFSQSKFVKAIDKFRFTKESDAKITKGGHTGYGYRARTHGGAQKPLKKSHFGQFSPVKKLNWGQA